MSRGVDRKQRSRRPRVLIVEPDEIERAAIGSCVRLAGGQPEAVEQWAAAHLETIDFDLVIWSHGLPEPVVQLDGRASWPWILIGEAEGASELARAHFPATAQALPKPYVPSILVAAIKSALHHAPSSLMELADRVELNNGLVFDVPARSVHLDGQTVAFSRQEWQLLGILASQPGCLLGTHEILALGWRAGEHQTDQIRIYIARLRRKLQPFGVLQLITRQGHGYSVVFAEPGEPWGVVNFATAVS